MTRLLRIYLSDFFCVGLVLLCFALQNIHAQILIPKITNYTKADYSGYLQNWSVDQTEEGLMAVGNMAGLMIYNGERWTLAELPNQKVVRSVKCVGNRIYVGSFEEFGFFDKNEDDTYSYTSLSNLLKNNEFRNDGFWSIVQVGSKIYFQSFTSIYEYDSEENTTTNIHPHFTPSKIAVIDSTLYAFAVNAGTFRYNNGQFNNVNSPDKLKSQSIHVANFPDKKQSLICSQSFDCYTFSNNQFKKFTLPQHEFFRENQLNSIAALPNGEVVFGSIQKGMLHYSVNGDNYILNYGNGLKNNTVLDIAIDWEGNIWLALDDGISYVENQSSNRYFRDTSGQLGAVFTAIEYENQIYLGSNKGLFYFQNGQLKSIPGINNQVWYLKIIDNQLICGHNQGTSVITKGNSTLISDITGGWRIHQVPNQKNLYLQSTYTGMVLFDFSQQPVEVTRLTGFVAPIKYFEWINDQEILVVNVNKGIYKLTLSPDYSKVNTVQNISTEKFQNQPYIKLTSINGSIVLYADQFYRYDKITHTVKKDSLLAGLFPESKGIITSENNQQIWSIGNEQIYQLLNTGSSFNQFTISGFDHLRVRDDEYITAVSDNDYLLTINNGFVLLEQETTNSAVKSPIIYSVSDGERATKQNQFNYNARGLSIHYATPEYQNNISYQYRLNEEEDWVTTNSSSLKFEKIGSGNYNFQVRSVYPNGEKSTVSHFSFKVAKHPLNTWPAYLIYLFLLLAIYYFYQRYLDLQLRKKQVQLKKELHKEHMHNVKEEKLRLEKRMTEIKNQQLRDNIRVKKKELANSTLSLVKKNELLSDIKSELLKAEKENDNRYLRKLLKNIDHSLSQKQNWELFETQFNEVHNEFLNQLKEDYPQLTKKDLKLCAYLKTNLTSKEIAPLMNISVRGVETHRYRLRKKLDIETNDNFQEFLEEITE